MPIHFTDNGEPLRLGTTKRMFTAKQRDALAARDGGCRFPDCDRPASWCEAHHRIPWKEGGPTDVRDGDPVHGFVAIPPRTVDPQQRPIPMTPKSPAAARLAAQQPLRR